MKFSKFGKKFTQKSGILELMDDLGNALETKGMIMLGGGNPASIHELTDFWKKRMQEVVDDEKTFANMVGDYDGPQGKTRFIEAVVGFFRREYGFNITTKNVAITPGSQSAFFYLFNILAGTHADGKKKKILLPIVPEYIGYADQGIEDDIFVTYKPKIVEYEDNTYKYFIDFDALEVTDDIAAICVSRPTNPTGNVITDDEVLKLQKLARENNIPLIIDNAYGKPFPDAIFVDSTLSFDKNSILSMSLSKVGLPSSRIGIIIASEEIVSALSSINAIVALANGSMGQVLFAPLLETGEIKSLVKNTINPFYAECSSFARSMVKKYFKQYGISYRIHKNQGSFFLWIWFKNLQISTSELYQKLKKEKVIIVPGEYFFPGFDDDWEHRHQCIRLNFGRPREEIEKGIEIIAKIVSLYQI